MSTPTLLPELEAAPIARRLFARAPGAGLAVRGAASTPVLELFGEVGADVTPSMVSERLDALAPRPITLRINSPGGNAFDGIAIFNLLQQYQGTISSEIVGVAASAASVIAMAGQTVRIAPSAFLMIHNCWGLTVGDKRAHDKSAGLLSKLDGAIAELYANKTGHSVDGIVDLMNAESWFAGNEAVENGFADELIADASPAKAFFDLSAVYREIPRALRERNGDATHPDMDQLAMRIQNTNAALARLRV